MCARLGVLLVAALLFGANGDPFAGERFGDLAPTLGESEFTAVASDPLDPQLLYAAAGGVIYRTEDDGATWQVALQRGGAGSSGPRDEDRASILAARADRVAEQLDEALEARREELFEELFEELEEVLGPDEAEQEANERADDALEEEREEILERVRGDVADELALPEAKDGASILPFSGAEVRELQAPAPAVLLASTKSGLFLSLDAGLSLAPLIVGASDDRAVRSAALDPRDPRRIFAATAQGLFSSEDGANFTAIGGALSGQSALQVRVSPLAPDRVLVATERGLFYAADGGREFREALLLPLGQGQPVVAVAFDEEDRDRAFAATVDGSLYASLDGGVQFERLAPTGIRGVTRALLAPSTSRSLVYVVTDQGLFVGDGQSFTELFDGLPVRDVRAVAVSARQPLRPIAATSRGLFQLGAVDARDAGPRLAEVVEKLAAAEPREYEVVRRVLEPLALEPERFEGLRSRARWAPIAPMVDAAIFGRRVSEQRLFDPALADLLGLPQGSVFARGLDDREWFVQGRWDFANVIFHSPAENNIEARAVRFVRIRRQLEDRTLRAIAARRQILAQLAVVPPVDARTYAKQLLLAEEQTARLDGLTGGWFSAELRKRQAHLEGT